MLFQHYKTLFQHYPLEQLLHTDLLQLAHQAKISSYYTPFEYINTQAKVVLLGITPGRLQWQNAIQAVQQALAQGLNDDQVLAYAKQQGAFSGPIRRNLIQILDHLGLQQKLQLNSTAALFNEAQHLVNMSAVLPHAIFINCQNYNGTSPHILKNDFLYQQLEQYFLPQLKVLPNAVYIPLGQSVAHVLSHLANLGYLKKQQILQGFPHPSGANSERIQYFLGKKAQAELSRATDPIKIEQVKAKLIQQMQQLQI